MSRISLPRGEPVASTWARISSFRVATSDVYKRQAHFWNFANSDLAPEFLNEPQELGLPVRGLFYGEEGFRHFFLSLIHI